MLLESVGYDTVPRHKDEHKLNLHHAADSYPTARNTVSSNVWNDSP